MVLDLPAYFSRLRSDFTDDLTCLMSDTAKTIVSPRWLAIATGGPVYSEWLDPQGSAPHIAATRDADLFLVLPATANTICKCAAGIADSMVTAAVSAALRPVVFAPAMNEGAWSSGPVRRAVQTLRDDGHYVIEPESYRSATEGREGGGRAVSQDRLLARLRHVLALRQAASYLPVAVEQRPQTPASMARPEERAEQVPAPPVAVELPMLQ